MKDNSNTCDEKPGMAKHEVKDDPGNSRADFTDDFFQAMAKKAQPFLVDTTNEPGPGEVILRAGGRVLSADENVLISTSRYFQRILGNLRKRQSQTKILDVDNDIDPFFLGVYLHLAYRQSMGGKPRLPNCGSSKDCRWLTAYIKIYQLCARFGNHQLEVAIYDNIGTWLTTNDGFKWPEQDISNSELIAFWTDTLCFSFHALDPDMEKEARLRAYLARAFVQWLPMERYSEFQYRIKGEPQFVLAVAENLARMVAHMQTPTARQPKPNTPSVLFDHVCNSAWEAYLEDLKEVSRAMATNILCEQRLSLEHQASMHLLLARSSRDLSRDPDEFIAHAIAAVSIYQQIRENWRAAGVTQQDNTRNNLLLAVDVLNDALADHGKAFERVAEVPIASAGKTTEESRENRAEEMREVRGANTQHRTDPQQQGLLD